MFEKFFRKATVVAKTVVEEEVKKGVDAKVDLATKLAKIGILIAVHYITKKPGGSASANQTAPVVYNFYNASDEKIAELFKF